MKAGEAVKEVMRKEDIKQAELCSRLKIKQPTLSERLSQKNISVNKLNEMLNMMGYKIVVFPRDAQFKNCEGIDIE